MLSRLFRRLRIHKQTYQAFFDLAGANDIPGLHRIIKNSKHGGWSAEKLLDKTRKALNETYHPRHLQERHPSWESNVATGASELNEFREKITITSKEENELKIPESKQGWSTAIYTDVHDLRRLNHLPSIHDGRADSSKHLLCLLLSHFLQFLFRSYLDSITLQVCRKCLLITVQMYFPKLLIVYNLSFMFHPLPFGAALIQI